jgi:hypothetical protein
MNKEPKPVERQDAPLQPPVTKRETEAPPPETKRRPAPNIEHEPEPDAENIMPAEDEPGTF